MRSLRQRMAVVAAAASGAALLAVLLLSGPGLRRGALEQTRQALLAEARLMARVVEEPLARGAGADELDPIVDDAADEVQARVTIIAPDGRVLADSAASGAALRGLESHADRPEVREALGTGTGSSIRRSATVGEDLFYAAVLVRSRGRTVGVARVAYSLAGVEAQAGELRRAVVAALVLAFVLTAVLSGVLAAPLAGPLREIMAAARQFAAGNLGARIASQRKDEIGGLARILDQAARELQERLAENARERARTQAILSAMGEGVLAVDHEGKVRLANDALRRALDIPGPLGRHFIEVIRQREVGEVLERVLETGERRAAEVEIRHRRRIYALTGVPYPGAEGAPPGAVLTFHDITERRRVDRMRRDFVANASHELRTPLTSVRGFVEALEDGALQEPATAQRFLGKIRVQADRMATLVEDLLELSRLEAGEKPPRWEEVGPAEIAQGVVSSFADLAAGRRLQLEWHDRGAPVVVSDGERVRRMLENLVDNAIKYTQEGGRVEVACVPAAEGGARIEVRDDGPGIAPEHLTRIFERFYRVDKARSRELGGTGLGLAIVKHLAESVGAPVGVSSEPGKGSCFTVTIPPGREHPVASTGEA